MSSVYATLLQKRREGSWQEKDVLRAIFLYSRSSVVPSVSPQTSHSLPLPPSLFLSVHHNYWARAMHGGCPCRTGSDLVGSSPDTTICRYTRRLHVLDESKRGSMQHFFNRYFMLARIELMRDWVRNHYTTCARSSKAAGTPWRSSDAMAVSSWTRCTCMVRPERTPPRRRSSIFCLNWTGQAPPTTATPTCSRVASRSARSCGQRHSSPRMPGSGVSRCVCASLGFYAFRATSLLVCHVFFFLENSALQT
jgi:hypothetical protein